MKTLLKLPILAVSFPEEKKAILALIKANIRVLDGAPDVSQEGEKKFNDYLFEVLYLLAQKRKVFCSAKFSPKLINGNDTVTIRWANNLIQCIWLNDVWELLYATDVEV